MLFLETIVSKLGSILIPLILGGPANGLSASQQSDEVSRLVGHVVEEKVGEYSIIDVAGEGAPIVGCVRVENDQLILESEPNQRFRLSGPLAIPRIAGPNYKVWVIGEILNSDILVVSRLGILATPQKADCNRH